MTVKEFQRKHALKYKELVNSEPFIDAITLLSAQKLSAISVLTDGDIEKNGRELLADLRGHIKLENDLMTLHSKKVFEFPAVPDEPQYPSPEEEEAETIKPKRKK